MICPVCQNEMPKKYLSRQLCCSKECSEILDYQVKVCRWISGLESGHKNSDNNNIKNFVRKYLLDKANHKCERCGFSGINPFTGKTILQIHHKDGNSENNKPENLEVICPNCHAMTETFMGLNRGKSSRIKRYGEVE